MSADDRFSRWMSEELGIEQARLGERLSGGNSNITQLVETPTGRLVLRRAPEATISPKAGQGIRREFLMLQAVGGTAPVPPVKGFCDDPSILGGVFVVTGFIDGVSITTRLPDAYDDTAQTVTRMGEELADALAGIHRADWRRLPADMTGRADDFLERQIDRWLKIRRESQVRDLPLIEELGGWLAQNRPPNSATAIVHGDYHLDNTLFRRDTPRLAAVIDWELATVGDPLTDLGLLLMFWGERATDTPGFPWVQQVSRRTGVISRQDLADRWSEQTGLPVDRLDYYMCFAFWRLAAIVEGAYILQHKGQVNSEYARNLETDVPNLLREAAEVISRTI